MHTQSSDINDTRFELQFDDEDNFDNCREQPPENKIIKLYVFFLLMFQATFHISDAALNALLLFLSMFLSLVSLNYGLESLKPFVDEMPCNNKGSKKVYGEE